VAEGTAVFEAARLGSTPRRGKRRPRGVPESHTTVRRSRTRFDSWRGHSPSSPPVPRAHSEAQRPGGRAAALPTAEVDSTPTGASFDSHSGPDRETGGARGKTGLRGAVARSRRHVK